MRVSAKVVPWSSIVGGGVKLLDPSGKVCFMVAFIGMQQGITKEQSVALSEQFVTWVNNHKVTVPEGK